MSVRSLAQLARQRRQVGLQSAPGALSPGPDLADPAGPGALERAVPSEIIVFYTAVIAACQAALSHDAATFTPFRVTIYLIALLLTGYAAARAVLTAVAGWVAAVRTAEWWTAVLSFAAWGLALPGSFLYVWLKPDALIITLATITAGATLVITVVLAPRLKQPASVPIGPTGPGTPADPGAVGGASGSTGQRGTVVP
jgi:hypothetical protein